ncbi:BlaI/MecI/CopY family transcriptional regulator [Anaerocolumna sp. AGMB13020]|uniref:BlaI/MecI/CopY family transcriptional regulator n=1 Tax=Anaerocolumna sp. AGMB13020 TaxID=3081750 RepID=UPI0029537691|nr:BlaI/MecI/CopY family transcriptional regulator [Anaerocolumna sp. AGMB13020]WOO35268.1 BlaI/MecI/CopY family transcriptional regulator [Anaerocolumna sp. AGMB13020]
MSTNVVRLENKIVDQNYISLTTAEWNLMEYLWDNTSCTGREVSDHFRNLTGWSRTTTLTLLHRAVKKGAVYCDKSRGIHTYAPLIAREDALMQETEAFLSRACKGSVSMMMSAITKKQELSRKELDELYEILRQVDANQASKDKEEE